MDEPIWKSLATSEHIANSGNLQTKLKNHIWRGKYDELNNWQFMEEMSSGEYLMALIREHRMELYAWFREYRIATNLATE